MSKAVPFNPISPAQAPADLAAVLEPDIFIEVYVLPGYTVITGMRPAEYNLFELDVHMRSHPFRTFPRYKLSTKVCPVGHRYYTRPFLTARRK